MLGPSFEGNVEMPEIFVVRKPVAVESMSVREKSGMFLNNFSRTLRLRLEQGWTTSNKASGDIDLF
jgi:hypothetical protein